MLKMVIEFDLEQVKEDDILAVCDLYKKIDDAVMELNLKKIKDGVYEDNGNRGDLTKFLAIMSWLRQAMWFKRYVTRWDWYNDHKGRKQDVIPENLIEGIYS